MSSLREFLEREPGLPATDVLGRIRSPREASAALRRIEQALSRRGDPTFRARGLKLAQMILERHPASRRGGSGLAGKSPSELAGLALAAVADTVCPTHVLPVAARPAAVLPDQTVWTTSPLRLDLAGGWSDTPPICTELGGCVLNTAITLNGQRPVQVVARLNGTDTIRIASVDLGEHVVIRDTRELLDHGDPHHWAALPKAALILAGIGPSDESEPLSRWLATLGGGVDLTTFSAVPKGSGLGTSSILGAAVIATLQRMVGEPLSAGELIARTSLLEQRMGTGGGWQDQVGGIHGGAKLILTDSGSDQVPRLQPCPLDLSPTGELSRRMLFYYTGVTRMARDILHQVLGRFLARDPETLQTLAELKAGALSLQSALAAGDSCAFARGVARYWTLKKQIDPGSTNPEIEAILESVRPWTEACTLAGAGGGGFVFLMARSSSARDEIRRHLEQHPPNPRARCFEIGLDTEGLRTAVL